MTLSSVAGGNWR